MDKVTITLLLLIGFFIWIFIGATVVVWLDARYFKRDMDTFGAKYAFNHKDKLLKVVAQIVAGMIAGPFMLLVGYYMDPLRKRGRKIISS